MSEASVRVRSPNYPSDSLPTALGHAERLFAKIHTHAAPRDFILQIMGYRSYNGASASALSALLKYGLLMKVGGDYKLTERAMAILHPRSSTEKAEAINTAARAPVLFAELLEHFDNRVPDDGILRSHLLRKEFAQSAVSSVIDAFRATMELVEGLSPGHNSAQISERAEQPMLVETASEAMAVGNRPPGPPPAPPSIALASEERELLHGPLSRKGSYRLVVRGDAGPKELGKLIKILELQKELLEDDEALAGEE